MADYNARGNADSDSIGEFLHTLDTGQDIKEGGHKVIQHLSRALRVNLNNVWYVS